MSGMWQCPCGGILMGFECDRCGGSLREFMASRNDRRVLDRWASTGSPPDRQVAEDITDQQRYEWV